MERNGNVMYVVWRDETSGSNELRCKGEWTNTPY